MRSLLLVLAVLPLCSCQLVPSAHGDPIELELDTGEAPEPVVQPYPWPVLTRIDTRSGQIELSWTGDPTESSESIPLEAVHRVELARAWNDFPDELFLHLVNSRRILISRGDPVSTHVTVLSAWLTERPIVVLPAGEGHLEAANAGDHPEPQLTVDAGLGSLDIQPIVDDDSTPAPATESTSNRSGASSSGRAHSEDIDRTIKTHMPRFRSCYQRQLQRNPRLEGRVIMEITIARDGSVSDAVLAESTMGDPVVETCIATELLRLEFPPPKGGEVVVNYPFAFSSR